MNTAKRAVVVGSGPNGLAAALALARIGVRVTIFEAADAAGGCLRTEPLTLPGYVHDAGAAVFPLAKASPWLRRLPLHRHGLQWIEPEIPLAHPLDNGDAVAQLHDLQQTALLLGQDGEAWKRLLRPAMRAWPAILDDVLAPVLRVPARPLRMAAFGMQAMLSARAAARSLRTERARALFAGLAAHVSVPFNRAASAGPGLILGAAAHTSGWPLARGGAQTIADAMVSLLREMDGEIVLQHRVRSLKELPPCDVLLLDLSPEQFVALAGDALSQAEGKRLSDVVRSPGVCKVDWALSSPIPWSAELPRRAGTVHLGGSFEEIAASECDAWEGRACRRPCVLLAQPSLFDATRAPAGMHTAWAYCHVPNGSSEDVTACIEAQVERFAPGFGRTILAKHTRSATAMERWNENLTGGDLSGGAMTLKQIVLRTNYRTPLQGVFLCSSSTSPGGGVHGMCGWFAARVAAQTMGLPRLHLP